MEGLNWFAICDLRFALVLLRPENEASWVAEPERAVAEPGRQVRKGDQ